MESSSQRHELIRREPIFHHPELIWDAGSFDEQIAEDFNEVGASGRRYSRSEVKEVVLGRLEGTHADSLADGYRIEEAESRIAGGDVRRALGSLGEPHKTVILLSYFGGLSHSRIADATGLPLGTVKSTIRQALARLRTILEER